MSYRFSWKADDCFSNRVMVRWVQSSHKIGWAMDLTSLFGVATKIDTPLMLAGLVVLVLYALYKNRIPPLQAKLLFVLALVAMVLGTVAFVYVPKPKQQYLIEGRVFSPPANRVAGLPDATVFLEIPGENPLVRRKVTDENGAFSFQISPTAFGKTAQYWVTANGHQASNPVRTTINASADPIEVGLQPIQQAAVSVEQPATAQVPDPGQTAQSLPSCLEGLWPERLVGRSDQSDTNKWNVHVQGTSLFLARQDEFVHGTFNQSSNQWLGDLSWGNGDVWHNVSLTPSSDCRTISTNQFWYFKR